MCQQMESLGKCNVGKETIAQRVTEVGDMRHKSITSCVYQRTSLKARLPILQRDESCYSAERLLFHKMYKRLCYVVVVRFKVHVQV